MVALRYPKNKLPWESLHWDQSCTAVREQFQPTPSMPAGTVVSRAQWWPPEEWGALQHACQEHHWCNHLAQEAPHSACSLELEILRCLSEAGRKSGWLAQDSRCHCWAKSLKDWFVNDWFSPIICCVYAYQACRKVNKTKPVQSIIRHKRKLLLYSSWYFVECFFNNFWCSKFQSTAETSTITLYEATAVTLIIFGYQKNSFNLKPCTDCWRKIWGTKIFRISLSYEAMTVSASSMKENFFPRIQEDTMLLSFKIQQLFLLKKTPTQPNNNNKHKQKNTPKLSNSSLKY